MANDETTGESARRRDQPKAGQPVQFRPGRLEPELEARVGAFLESAGAVAKRDLHRYYHLLGAALGRVHLRLGEAQLLCDVSNGTLWEPHTLGLLWAQVEDALEDGYAEKWDVGGEALVARLKALSPLESAAVVDAIERAWSAEGGPTPETLARVGLVRP